MDSRDLSMCMDVRLDVFMDDLYMLMKIIVFVVDDRDHIIVKMC
jgi:hypothetical protein